VSSHEIPVSSSHAATTDRRERFVDLEQIDITGLHVRLLENLLGRGDGARQHQYRIDADDFGLNDASHRLPPVFVGGLLARYEKRTRTVDDSGGIPRVDDAVALVAKRRRQIRERLEIRVWPRVFVLLDDDSLAVDFGLDGDELTVEPSLVVRSLPAAV